MTHKLKKGLRKNKDVCRQSVKQQRKIAQKAQFTVDTLCQRDNEGIENMCAGRCGDQVMMTGGNTPRRQEGNHTCLFLRKVKQWKLICFSFGVLPWCLGDLLLMVFLTPVLFLP